VAQWWNSLSAKSTMCSSVVSSRMRRLSSLSEHGNRNRCRKYWTRKKREEIYKDRRYRWHWSYRIKAHHKTQSQRTPTRTLEPKSLTLGTDQVVTRGRIRRRLPETSEGVVVTVCILKAMGYGGTVSFREAYHEVRMHQPAEGVYCAFSIGLSFRAEWRTKM
jgi:hypothetical protein